MLERLYGHLRKEPLRRKVLITQTYAMGHQWLDQISRRFGPVLNTEVESVEGFIAKQARMGLVQAGFKELRPQAGFWIVRKLMTELSSSMPDPYVPLTLLSPGVIRSFHRAIEALRQAGLSTDQLHIHRFENAQKGVYVQALLASYEQELARLKRMDLAGLVPFVSPLTVPVTLVMPVTLELTSMQEEAIRRSGFAELVPVESETRFTDVRSGFPIGDCAMLHATGPMNEVREVLRRIGERGCSLDEVEIIASDYATYAPALYAQTEQLGIPCSFSGGVPLVFSGVGRAVRLYLEWIENGYATESLARGLRQGEYRLPEGKRSEVIRMLETSGIGWGRERYEAWLSQGNNEEEESVEERSLREWITSLLAWTPRGMRCSPYALLEGALKLVAAYVPIPDERERALAAMLRERLDDYPQDQELEMALALRYLLHDLEEYTIWAESTPKPGRIHVSSLRDGGCSGRPHTYIIGMSEQAWTDSVRQDPVLLDGERVSISPLLMTSKQMAELREKERGERLGMIRGICTVSFSSFDLTSNKEVHPAYELLQLYRLQRGRPDADFDQLMASLGPVCGYVPSTGRALMDGGEAWLTVLADGQGRLRRAGDILYAHYGHLHEGWHSRKARAALTLSAYEGLVDTSSYSIAYTADESTAMSVSRLEQYARCPLQFFYAHVLKVRPKETAVFDRSSWLDPLQRGSLLHEIFQQYYERLHARGGVPAPHDRQLLGEVAEETIASYAVQIPAPSAPIFDKERLALLRDVEVFWRSEQEHGQQPSHMELALHSEEQPFLLELGEELTLPLRGIVDRIDRVGAGAYRIYDYKTGKHKKYSPGAYFAGGTQLQHAIYAAAVEQWLQQGGEASAHVEEAAYYFPTETGLGEMVVRTQDRREALHAIVGSLLGAMGEGLFPPTKEPAICAWCDYQAVCGSLAQDTLEKRESDDNASRLRLVEEVIGHD